MSGMPKDAGSFYYRLTMNVFNQGDYDDNFVTHKLPRVIPAISQIKSKLYPITRLVKKRYFLNVDLTNEDEFRLSYNRFLTDFMFGHCTDRFNKLLSSNGVLTYAYSFEYRGQYSVVNLMGETVDMGVSLGDDLQYLFSLWGTELTMSQADLRFSGQVFVPMIANFARTG